MDVVDVDVTLLSNIQIWLCWLCYIMNCIVSHMQVMTTLKCTEKYCKWHWYSGLKWIFLATMALLTRKGNCLIHWFKEHNEELSVSTCPPNFSDSNLIENPSMQWKHECKREPTHHLKYFYMHYQWPSDRYQKKPLYRGLLYWKVRAEGPISGR